MNNKDLLFDKIYNDDCITALKSCLDKRKDQSKAVVSHKFVFVCGSMLNSFANESLKGSYLTSDNRGFIRRYILSKNPTIHVVYSERLFEQNSKVDLLTFEEFLAEISDLIILPIESAGTICELGAFAHSEGLLTKKLLVIVDNEYKDADSFIVQGPVRKVANSKAKVIYAPVNAGTILTSELTAFIDERLAVFKQPRRQDNFHRLNPSNIGTNTLYLNSFIHELIELMQVASPISQGNAFKLYKKIKDIDSRLQFVKSNGEQFHKQITQQMIFKLLKDAGIIRQVEEDLYSSCEPLSNENLFLFQEEERIHKKLENQRLSMLSRIRKHKKEMCL
ncbi:hypothetical protein CRD60_01315 [Bifidobacterium aemilianum]|uniref:Uncharacterized protein n=1 Tax=Bifidobacterium aemilianum TaxID=2493120 RepID=A0A366KAY5_9BIFI|nr:retron St85 family effector protein [Bifidobacterium aemilianum]RBP98527.1 hypothetical protein CRD60_01315 [Bifidobacterium aemilianum]